MKNEDAALTWRAEIDARLHPTQFIVLATAGWLEHLDGPPTQQQVADATGTDRQMTSRVVRTLQDRGLIGWLRVASPRSESSGNPLGHHHRTSRGSSRSPAVGRPADIRS
ncbi:helix-turn-helix domain-containing protein [Nocardia sp. alder85J]|uniref:helix-turn-helix domain-containing protein n=1 Tax=Nocardia sp. alder85J TaxID=2862949 RepID=UPI001CD24DF3